MGELVKIKSNKYTFYLDGRNIYLHLNDSLKQNFTIQTYDFLKLDQWQYVSLVDSIYRKKIFDTNSLNEQLMCKYRLIPTVKKL